MDSTTLAAQGGWDCVGWLTWLPWLVVRNPRNSYGWCREFAVSIFEASCSLKTCQERATFWAVLISAEMLLHAYMYQCDMRPPSPCGRVQSRCGQSIGRVPDLRVLRFSEPSLRTLSSIHPEQKALLRKSASKQTSKQANKQTKKKVQ